MTDAARKAPIVPFDDSDLDDPDTSLIEALRDSDRPERVMRAQELARQKVVVATELLRRRKARSDPPSH